MVDLNNRIVGRNYGDSDDGCFEVSPNLENILLLPPALSMLPHPTSHHWHNLWKSVQYSVFTCVAMESFLIIIHRIRCGTKQRTEKE